MAGFKGLGEQLRLQNALFVYADDLEEARAIRSLWQDRMNLEWRERADLDAGLHVLKVGLRGKLRTGQLRLRGFMPGDPKVTEADPYWCTNADFEPDNDTATAHGVTLHDVRVFPGAGPEELEQPLGDPSPQPRQTTAGDHRFREWAASLDAWPTKREAEAWAKRNGISVPRARILQREKNQRGVGRPQKPT